jgi:hypothetical protein
MDKKEQIKNSLEKLNTLLQTPLRVGGKRVLEFRFWLEVDEEVLKEMLEQPNVLYLDELIYVLEHSLESRTMRERYGSGYKYKLPDWVDKVGQVECVLPKGFEV